jgi:iron complex transport system substrate-binding protein
MRIKLIIFAIFIGFNVSAQKIERVVSLAPSITKNIYLMGAQKKLIGCTSYCPVNEQDKIEIVGNAVKVNIEKIMLLKPDLVLTTALTSVETIAMLNKAGIKCKVFETPKDFEGICNQFIEISQLLDKENHARSIIAKEKAKLDSLKNLISGKIKSRIFIELGAKPLFAVIPNTFMHDYIAFVGGQNIATDMSTGIISRETVLMKNPDVIFITTMGATGNEEISTWMKYKKLNASKNKKIFTLDSDMACTPTPDSYTKTVETMIKLMYKK